MYVRYSLLLTSVAMNRPIENAAAHDRNVIVVRHFLNLNGCNDMMPLTTQCHIAICGENKKYNTRRMGRLFTQSETTYLLSNAEHDEHKVEEHGPKGRNVLGTDHGERGRE